MREFTVALGQRGHRVHIIAQQYDGMTMMPGLGTNVTLETVVLTEQPFPGFWRLERFLPLDDLRFARAAARKVYGLHRTEPVDIVEVMDYFRQGIWLALFKRLPLFLRLHGWMFNRHNGRVNPNGTLNFKERILWHFQQKCINEADGIAAVSRDFAEFAGAVWRFEDKPVTVIHNAVNVQKYSAEGIKMRERAVVFVARLAKFKGTKVLADSVPDVLAEFPDTKFYFAGKDLYWKEEGIKASEYLRRRIPAKNLAIAGEIGEDALKALYQRCTVCALPSLYESFGMTALEAMASGCALVASRCGGITEIVTHGKEGLLITPGEAKELSQAICLLFRDAALRERCAANALVKVQEHFNYEHLAQETIAAYQNAIDSFQKKIAICL